MEKLLKERSETITKIINHMKTNKINKEKLFLSLKAQSELKNLENKIDIKSIKKKIKNSNEFQELFDEEIELVKSKKSDICCFTQIKINDKWENVCGHFYERSVVIEYIKTRPSKTCPAVGCSSKILEKKS